MNNKFSFEVNYLSCCLNLKIYHFTSRKPRRLFLSDACLFVYLKGKVFSCSALVWHHFVIKLKSMTRSLALLISKIFLSRHSLSIPLTQGSLERKSHIKIIIMSGFITRHARKARPVSNSKLTHKFSNIFFSYSWLEMSETRRKIHFFPCISISV